MTDPTPGSAAPSPETPDDTEPRSPEPPPSDPLRASRTSGLWLAVVALVVVLVLLVIFIAQNTQDVHVSFLGWDGEAALSVTLLIAAIAGMTLAAVAGSLRIFQLRRRVRRTRT